MDKCWASCLGNCCDKISREHIISASLFKNTKLVTVQGFHWCLNEEKEIGLSSLTANILCKHHNSLLSDLDLAAGHAFNIFEDIATYINEAVRTNGRFKARSSNVNALYLERWLLKTLINVSYGYNHFFGNGQEIGVPDEHLVNVSFGRSKFRQGAGMYFASNEGEKLSFDSKLNITPLIYLPENRIVGAMFTFAGMQLFLWLKPEELPKHFEWITHMHSEWKNLRPSRPFKKMSIQIPSGDSHIIKFNW